MSVAEDAQQDPLVPWFVARRFAERPQDLAGIMAQAELEEAVAELLAVGAAADSDPVDLEDLGHCDADRAALCGGELLAEPSQDRLVAVRVGVELEGEARHASTVRTTSDGTRTHARGPKRGPISGHLSRTGN